MTSEAEREADGVANTTAAPERVEQGAPSDADGMAAAELAELKDRLLRALAEQENFRRRAERERAEAVKYAAAGVVKDLLATADNLGRALASVPPALDVQDPAMQKLLSGVAATERVLHDTFINHGIRKIEPRPGESFDPDLHQALCEVAASEYPPGTVVEVILPGYTYHQRLLRPALVGVADHRGSKNASDEPSVND
jgi:molecular chaperone GrpE